jgi:hypothetical protein
VLLYLMLTSVCAAWFWFSLHPGSLLGLAVTGGDWMRLLRNLDSKQLQTRSALRAAGRRSIATHFILGGLGITAGVAVGNYTLAAVGPRTAFGSRGLCHWLSVALVVNAARRLVRCGLTFRSRRTASPPLNSSVGV